MRVTIEICWETKMPETEILVRLMEKFSIINKEEAKEYLAEERSE